MQLFHSLTWSSVRNLLLVVTDDALAPSVWTLGLSSAVVQVDPCGECMKPKDTSSGPAKH